MLIKFFGGTGGGAGIASYLVDPAREGREAAPPEILSGNIDRTRALIDSIDRKWTYSTGVISFAREDQPTASEQQALMADFERLAFAGLDRDRYDITWVRHSHTDGGRVELHFLVPRVDLATGRDFNIAPPGWEKSYAPLRDAYNFAHGWARPDDPARSRTQQRTAESEPRAQGREAITAFLEQKIIAGEVVDRTSLLSALNEVGFETPRAGKNYVTALDPDTGERWRLKGRIYEKDWTRDAELDRAASSPDARAQDRIDGIDAERAAAARDRLEAIIEHRAAWVGERYPDATDRLSETRDVSQDLHGERSDRDPREAKTLDRDQREHGSSGREPDMGRSNALDPVAAASGDAGDKRERDLSGPARDGGDGLALWQHALRKIGGLNVGETDGDRTRALGRIREIGLRVRDFGANAVEAVRSFFGRDAETGTQAGSARTAFDASERSLGAAEQLNDRLDREISSIEQQVKIDEKFADLQRGFERQKVR